jgi:hypothetical protein
MSVMGWSLHEGKPPLNRYKSPNFSFYFTFFFSFFFFKFFSSRFNCNFTRVPLKIKKEEIFTKFY